MNSHLSADMLACVNWHRRKCNDHAVRALEHADAMIAAILDEDDVFFHCRSH
jgi:hypothetical protein